MILLLAAMPQETELIAPGLGPEGEGPWPLMRGTIGGREVALCHTGLGLANAAAAGAATLARLGGVECVVNFGCAGAYAGSGLILGAAAVASEAVMADMGVACAGRWHPVRKIGIPVAHGADGGPLYNRLPVDAALGREIAGAAGGLIMGPFASVNQASGDEPTAAALEARWDAIMEDMETAALALVCLAHGVAFAAVRGVSNIAGRRELDIKAGSEAAQRALLAWLERAA